MRSIWKDMKASAISFIIGLVVILMVISAVVGTVAYNLYTASTNTGVAAIPGGAQLVLILGLLFIVIPLTIMAKAAR